MSLVEDVWTALEIDLEDSDFLEAQLPDNYAQYYHEGENRPHMMEAFDRIIGEYGHSLLQKILEYQMRGGKLVGTYCAHIPDEIIYAAGAIPLALCSASAAFAELGEQFMPTNTCPLVRASVGARLTKSCPYAASADFLIGETSCDAKTKAWPIMETDARMHIIYLPKRREPEDTLHYQNELALMIETMEDLTGNKVTEESLSRAITILNDQRRAIKRMWDFRKQPNIPISGKDCLLAQECSKYIAPKQHTELINQLCDELEERVAQDISLTTEETPRILIAGSPTGLQQWNINAMIESSGGMVVVEETCASTRVFERLVKEDASDMDGILANLTEKYFNGIHCACFTPNQERLDDLVRLCQDYFVDGVIDISLKFCQIFDIENYFVAKYLDDHDIPNIKLEVDYGDDSSGQMLTRIQAFLEMVQPQMASH